MPWVSRHHALGGMAPINALDYTTHRVTYCIAPAKQPICGRTPCVATPPNNCAPNFAKARPPNNAMVKCQKAMDATRKAKATHLQCTHGRWPLGGDALGVLKQREKYENWSHRPQRAPPQQWLQKCCYAWHGKISLGSESNALLACHRQPLGENALLACCSQPLEMPYARPSLGRTAGQHN